MEYDFSPKGYGWKQHPGEIRSGEAVLKLHRRLDNAADPNAIQIKDLRGASCGWVPRKVASEIARVLDRQELLQTTVEVISWEGKKPVLRAGLGE